ncbi:MAG: hypothetical protein H6570_05325 [Lewinellaceae bacterium]|nr:hypothetical protein [Lewinellaceae bacterium]
MNIQPYLEQINNLNPLEQVVYFNSDHWVNFDYKNNLVSDEMIFIAHKYANHITRGDIINHLRSQHGSLMSGFILTMIWGHGYSENGRADNRGPWKVSNMLNTYDQALTILESAKTCLEKNDIHAAHVSFNQMKRCRVNFFSKFLYFLGRSLNMKKYPLIFDARVAKTISLVNSINQDLCHILNIEPNQKPEAYVHYVNQMHEISQTNDVDADKLELFFFKGL